MEALSVVHRFLYSQFFVTPPLPTLDCYGKTIIVTGSNVGLGFEAAKHFTRLHASKVILAVRSIDKGEEARRKIESATGRKGAVEVWALDLSSYESVKEFAKRCEGLERIDAVVENAGIVTRKFQMAEDNESTITVNVVSTFLLALLLIPTLKRSAQKHNIRPHLSIISSEVHFFTSFPERHKIFTSSSSSASETPLFDVLNNPKTAMMDDRYYVSKLLEVFACREICAQHPQPGYPIIINFVNPGFCHSELAREMKEDWSMWLMKLLLARSTEVGSRTLVHAALAGEDTHGKYLSDCVVKPPAPLVLGREGAQLQKRVWRELGVKLEKIQPGILGNL